MTEPTQPAPGTAGLYEMVQALQTELHETQAQLVKERGDQAKQAERMRSMIFFWGDDLERKLGYGQGDRPPRTAQIRQDWRARGMPDVRKKTNDG